MITNDRCAIHDEVRDINGECHSCIEDSISNLGLGLDNQTHDDPYCAAIAPYGSYEARHGEVCSMCEQRNRCGICARFHVVSFYGFLRCVGCTLRESDCTCGEQAS